MSYNNLQFLDWLFFNKVPLICFRKTKVRALVVCLQFPEDYPNCPILLELKSKRLSDALLRKLTQSCESELKKIIGKPQVNKLCEFLNNIF